jgi:hypothetical protein
VKKEKVKVMKIKKRISLTKKKKRRRKNLKKKKSHN